MLACLFVSLQLHYTVSVMTRSNNMITQALDTVKQRLEETEGPDVKEQMQDQIRQWFIETRCTMCVCVCFN